MNKQKPALDDLTQDQQTALLRFKQDNGRSWKTRLLDGWTHGWRGYDPPMSAELQQIRNQKGPSWLFNLKLPR